MGSSVRFIKKLCPGANVEDGTPIHGAEAANADSEAKEIAELAKQYHHAACQLQYLKPTDENICDSMWIKVEAAGLTSNGLSFLSIVRLIT